MGFLIIFPKITVQQVLLLLVAVSLLLCITAYPQEHATPYEGVASWYSEDDPGILATTANMEVFDDGALTCAIWNVPFNTLIKVTNLNNGKSIIVRVNDRGPAKRLVRQGRVIDLTKEAFSRIANLRQGLIPVKLAIISSR